MRTLGFLALLFLVCSCAEKRQWPAAVVNYSGFDGAQEKDVREAIELLNATAGTHLVLETGDDSNHFRMSVELSGPNPEKPNEAGVAEVFDDKCIIHLSQSLFEERHEGIRAYVVWHEIGHCAGLQHVNQSGEIMSASSPSNTNYSQESIQRFITNIKAQAGL